MLFLLSAKLFLECPRVQIFIYIGFLVFNCNCSNIWYDIHIIASSIHFVGVLNFSILLTNCYCRAIITMIFSIVVIVISIVGTYTTFFLLSSSSKSYRAPRHHHYRHHISEILDLFRCALCFPCLRCGAVSK